MGYSLQFGVKVREFLKNIVTKETHTPPRYGDDDQIRRSLNKSLEADIAMDVPEQA